MTLAQTEVPRILIADDEAPARSRLRDLLDECRAEFPLAIVDEAKTGREVLDVVNREKVDIVLLDIRMPEMDGMEAARHLAGMAAPPSLIFTTAFDSLAALLSASIFVVSIFNSTTSDAFTSASASASMVANSTTNWSCDFL